MWAVMARCARSLERSSMAMAISSCWWSASFDRGGDGAGRPARVVEQVGHRREDAGEHLLPLAAAIAWWNSISASQTGARIS